MFEWLKRRGTIVVEDDRRFGRYRLYDSKRNLGGQDYGFNEVCHLEEKAKDDVRVGRMKKQEE